MSKRQDKKEIMPNFLKDLNTEILEQLTAGSSEKNVVGLAGDVKELKAVEDICGLRFKGYLGLIEVERPSGITDTLVVAFAWNTPYKSTQGVEFDVLREYPAGSRLLLYGKMQTLKEFSTGRQQVFVLADFVALSPKAEQQNDIVLVGEIVYKPTYRETPRGKRISDIFVKVKNQLTKCSSLIPCICWNETADEVANWLPGDTVKLIGRLQSREYEKLIEEIYADGVVAERVTETRTAYEVSVHTIKKGEVQNEEQNNFRSRRHNENAGNYSRDKWKRRRGRHKSSAETCRHDKQLKAVPNAAGSIRQIFTDYGVL